MERVEEFMQRPRRSLFRLTYPILISMVVQLLYNIIDTAFVGRLGSEAIAALTFSFPVLFILISLNSGIGIGMRSRISRLLGAGKERDAENAATHGLIVSVVVAGVILLLGLLFIEELFSLFGASEAVKPLAISYLRIVLVSIFFLFMAGIFQNIFNAQGDTKTPMKITVASVLVNILLDPLFIYGLDMGVAGAALATAVAFSLSFVLFVILFRKKSMLGFRFRGFIFQREVFMDILRVGLPASVSMLMVSVYLIFINRFMAYFGTDHVSTFGIVARLESFAVMPIGALSLALVTMVGMFYGAGYFYVMEDLVWYSLRCALLFAILMGIPFFLFPDLLFRVFTPDQAIIDLGRTYMRVNVFTFPLMGVTMTISRVMQGMGLGLPGLVINLLRVLVVAVPLAWVMIYILQMEYFMVPVAGICGGVVAAGVAVFWVIRMFRVCRESGSWETG